MAACAPTAPIPTVAVLPTDAAAGSGTSKPNGLTNSATIPANASTKPPTPTVRPTNTSIPTPTDVPTLVEETDTPIPVDTTVPTLSGTSNPKAMTLNTQDVALQVHQIQFTVSITPQLAPISAAVLSYTFPKSKKTQQQKVSPPKNEVGQLAQLFYSMDVKDMPVGEDQIVYTWQATDKNGNTLTGKPGQFKITEAISEDPRDDLPVMPSKQTYASEFPRRSIFTVTVTSKERITDAKFYFTQNAGVLLQNNVVPVPLQDPNTPLTLTFTWSNALGAQIPWQQFEFWWVLVDQAGKYWRTDHMFYDYADKTFHQWTKTKTQYAYLYTYDRSAADISVLSKATDDSMARLTKEFNYKLRYQPHIVLYNSARDFLEWGPPAQLAESAIGVASGDWGGAVIEYYNSINFTGYSIIQHELTHLFQYQSRRSGSQNLPTWWIEGSARYFEQIALDDYEGKVRRIAKAKGAPNLAGYVGFRAPDGSNIAWPYYVGLTFVKYIRQTYGNDVFAKIHVELAKDVDFSDALQAATGKSLTDLNTDYGKWILN